MSRSLRRSHRSWLARFRVPLSILMIVAALATNLSIGQPNAAAATGFTSVFSTNAPGNITYVSNTLMTCSTTSGSNKDRCVSNGQNGTWANNNFTMLQVDVDGDPTTSNSSSNDLTLAAGATVLFAGLFWVGYADRPNNFDPNIKLATPTSGYTDLSASHIDNYGSRHYGAYVDVTSLVQAGGNGTYTVGGADLDASGAHRYGGWTLAIAYEDNNEPWRNLSIFNGYDFVYSGNSYNVPLTVSGFNAPPVGPVNATIGVQTGEGDARYTGPSTEVNGTTIFDAMNPVNNTQNSTISIVGTPGNTLANPSYPNQLGFDADIIEANGLIPPNATSANLRFRSSGDVYGINLISTAIDIYVPNLTSSLTKTGTDLNAEDTHPGDIIEYRVSFDNSGEDPAASTVITDLVPAGTTYVPNSLRILQDSTATGAMTDAAGDDNAFFDAGSNTATFHVGDGATPTSGGEVQPLSQGGQVHEVAFQVRVDTGTEGSTISNAARVDYIAKFLNEAYSATTNPVTHDVTPLVDLTIDKSDDADPVLAGGNVVYTLDIGNAGPSTAENVEITDTLPTGTAFVSGSGCSASGATVTCAAGDIVSGGSYSVDITVSVDGDYVGTTITNVAEVSSDTHEHETGDNATKEATGLKREADVTVKKTAPATASAGGTFTYTIEVGNLGASDALNVKMVDPIPSGVTLVSASADLGGTCDTDVACTWPSLAAGAVSTVTIVVDVPASTDDGTVITNKVKAGSSDADPDTSNNTSGAETIIEKLADLQVRKTGPELAVAGDQISYTLEMRNVGPSDAVSAEIIDPIPSSDFTFNAVASSSGCSVSGTDVVCSAGTMAPGDSASFTVVFDIASSVVDGTAVTNKITGQSKTKDPETANNTDSVETKIVRESDLSVRKDDNTALAVGGTQISYTLDYANAGKSDASGVVISDTLPAGVTFNVASSPGCSAAGSAVTCTVGVLVAGDSGTFTVVVDVDPSITDGAGLLNTATIEGNETDPNLKNNETAVKTPAERSAELELTKVDDVDPVIAGNDITYTVSVKNIGPSTDDNIVVTDTLPPGVTFVSASPGCAEAAGVVTCTAGTLLPGASASFDITVTSSASLANGTLLENSAAAQGDVSPSIEVVEETTVNTVADVSIAKVAPAEIVAGTSMTYVIKVDNAGPSDAANVVVTDALPTGTTYRSHAVTSGTATCTTTASNINCAQTTLAPGASMVIEVVVDVAETVVDTSTISNTALVKSDTADSAPGNNTATASTDVERSADIALAKTAITAEVVAGEQATYQLVVTNNGPSQATSVSVTDALPAGFTFNATDSSSECVAGIVCTVPASLNTGESWTFTVVADVGASVAPGTWTNDAEASAAETDPNAANNEAKADVDVVTEADVSVVKSSTGTTFTPGTNHLYTVTVSNEGPSDAQDVVVTDVLPAGLTFVPGGSSPECVAGVTCTVATLASGTSTTFTISVDIDPSLTGSLTNEVSVATSTSDPDPSNDIDNDVTPLVPEADLEIAKAAPATVVAGSNLTYTLTLKNNGPSDALNVEAVDLLPADVTFVSASPGCAEASGEVTCSAASVATGATMVWNITVAVPASTADELLLTNEVDVTTDAFDPDMSNNGDEADTLVERVSNLTIGKGVSAANANAGTTVTYTITVLNEGPSNAEAVSVLDTLPTGMTVSTVSANVGSCSSVGSGISCYHPDLAPGVPMVITLLADIDSSVADSTTLTNSASTSTDTAESNDDDNTASVPVTVEASADLAIAKDSGVTEVTAGEDITYTITVTNNGPSDALSVVVDDTVPSDLTIVSVAPLPACSFVDAAISCAAGTLADGEIFEATVVATVSEGAVDGSTLSNTASVSSATNDPNDTNDEATDETTVAKSADLSITKAAAVDTVSAGETLLYNVTVANAGPSSATDIDVSDQLPAGVTFNSTLSNSNCSEAAGMVDCSFPTLAANSDFSFVIAVDLPATLADGTNLVNAVDVSATEDDPDADNNDDTDELLVTNEADLSIVKDASGFAIAGESITWTLDVANAGPANAVNLTVSDTLPTGTTFNVAGSDSRCSVSGSTVTCSLALLASSGTDSFDIEVDVASSVADLANLSNTATVSSDTEDSNDTNDSSTDDVPVQRQSSLSIVKADLVDPVIAGEQAMWSITVSNAGPSDADNVTITDTLPTGFSLVSVDDTTNCTTASNTVNCSFPTVVDGGTVVVVVTADVSSDLVDGTTHQNKATANSDSSDEVSDTEDTTVERRSDLTISKTSDGAVVAGTNQTYTVTVVNEGPSDANNVVVTDALPAGVTFVSDSASACTAVLAVVTCDLGTMVDGATTSFDLVVAVSDSATNPTINVVDVDSDSTDPSPDDNEGNNSVAITYEADLSIEKTASPTPAVPGEDITWTITVTNDGPSIANNVVVEDPLPTGVSFVSASAGCSHTSGIVTCANAALTSGSKATFTVVGAIDSSLVGSVANTATVSSDTPDPDTSDNEVTETTPLAASADLAVVKTSSPNPVIAGEVITYTLTVTNDGPSDAVNVVLLDELPSNLTPIDVQPIADCGFVGQTATCGQASLAPGATWVVTITATLDEAAADRGVVQNTASVSSDTPDPDTDNNADTEVTDVQKSADLSVLKDATVTDVAAGERLIYGITVVNDGPSSATDILVLDTLPAGVVYDSALSSTSCGEAAGIVTCGFPLLAANSSFTFSIVVDLPSGLADNTNLVNNVSVGAAEDDPDDTNNTDTHEITLANEADLSVVKDASGFVIAGQTIAWDLEIHNAGVSDAVNVVVSDTLPANTTFDAAASDPRCSVASGVVTCVLPAMVAGTSDTFTITVDAASSLPDASSISNTATISSDITDPDPNDNSSTDSVPVLRDSDLSIVKTDLADPVVAGEQAMWSIVVANAGPSDAANVTIADTLPAGFTMVSVDDTTNCSTTSTSVDCTFASVAAGTSVEIVVTADVDANLADGSNHSNTATANSDSSPVVSDTEDTTVIRQSDLVISKISDALAVAGTQQTYDISVTNNGPSDADNVVVTDILPTGVTFVEDSLSSCVVAGSTVVCDLGTLAGPETADFTLTVYVDDAAGTEATNNVVVDSDSEDPYPLNNDDTDVIDVSFDANLSVSKSVTPDPATAGEDVTWTIRVANAGPSMAHNVVVTDVLPAGVTFVSASGTCVQAAGTVTCTDASMAAASMNNFQITATLDSNFAGSLENTASVMSDTADSDVTDNEATAIVDTRSSADLGLAKVLLTDPVVAGQNAVFALTVNNDGPSAASAVEVTDVLPPEMTFVSASAGCAHADGVVTCAEDTLAVGASSVFEIEVLVDSAVADGTDVVNTATVQSATPDPDTAGNVSSATAPISRSSQLVIDKTTTTEAPMIGEAIEWEIVVTNNGPSAATNVVLSDAVSPAFSDVSVTDPFCEVDGNDVSCDRPTLLAGQTWTVLVSAVATNDAAGDQSNTAEVASDSSEAVADIANFVVGTPEVDLAISKLAQDTVSANGDTVEWIIQVENNGEATATEATVTDDVPANQRLLSVVSPHADCTSDGNSIVCLIAPGFTGTADIVVVTEVLDITQAVQNTAGLAIANGPDLVTDEAADVAGVVIVKRADGVLAFTGGEAFPIVMWSLALLGAGSLMLWGSRRTRREAAEA